MFRCPFILGLPAGLLVLGALVVGAGSAVADDTGRRRPDGWRNPQQASRPDRWQRERFRNGSAAERREMHEKLRERWQEATPNEREAAHGKTRKHLGRRLSRETEGGARWDKNRERYREAEPNDRRGIERSLQERWPERENMQRRHTGEIFRRHMRSLSAAERLERRQHWQDVGGAERQSLRRRLGHLKPEERRKMAERMSRYRALPQAEQQQLRDRMMQLRSFEPSERMRIQRNARQFQSLPEAERQQLRKAWQRLRALPPDEREKKLERLLSEFR